MANEPDCQTGKKITSNGMCGGVYGLAFLGAAVYYVQHSSTFWEGVLGILKAIIWPAVLMYKLLDVLKL